MKNMQTQNSKNKKENNKNNKNNKSSKNNNEELLSMRLDKFLKVSRIIKRRTIAKDFCDSDRVIINDRDAKASAKIKAGDIVKVKFGDEYFTFKVLFLNEKAKKDDSKEMYEIL